MLKSEIIMHGELAIAQVSGKDTFICLIYDTYADEWVCSYKVRQLDGFKRYIHLHDAQKLYSAMKRVAELL